MHLGANVAGNKKRGWLRTGLKRAAGRLRGPSYTTPKGPFPLTVEGHTPIDVQGGATILQAAVAGGVDISHYCGGMASCGTCKIEVLSGVDNLVPMDGREQMVLGSQSAAAGHRLACQARVVGPVSVRIPRWF